MVQVKNVASLNFLSSFETDHFNLRYHEPYILGFEALCFELRLPFVSWSTSCQHYFWLFTSLSCLTLLSYNKILALFAKLRTVGAYHLSPLSTSLRPLLHKFKRHLTFSSLTFVGFDLDQEFSRWEETKKIALSCQTKQNKANI